MAQIVRFGFHYSQETHTHTHTHTKRHKSFKHPKASRKGQNLMTLLYPGINSSTKFFLPWWNLEVGGWGQALCSDRVRFFFKENLRKMEGLRNPLGTSFLHEREKIERERERSLHT